MEVTRKQIMDGDVPDGATFGGSLYLRGCDLKGIKLPTSVGGSLDLRGCDLKGIKLPTSVGGSLYLSGCDLKGIKLPTSVGGSLGLSGSKGLHAKDAADFCRLWGIAITDDVVVLFKAVNENFMSERGGYYTPGTIPIAADWDGGKMECGAGLHFCATPAMAKTFNQAATRFVACPIKLSDIAIHADAEYPHKVKARGCCAPTWEVDIDGKAIKTRKAKSH